MDELKKILSGTGFSEMDLAFADFILRLEQAPAETDLFLIAALASCAVGHGHVCCDLNVFAGHDIVSEFQRMFPDPETDSEEKNESSVIRLPSLTAIRKMLESHPAIVSFPPEIRPVPLVLDRAGRLYLNRYYSYEQEFAENLRTHLEIPPDPAAVFDPSLSSRFTERNEQYSAAAMAYQQNFTIITGGPGTGKTTVAASILAAELMRDPNLELYLCAPTGKAQVRLHEAILEELPLLNIPESVADRLKNAPCSTINRMLGTIYASPNFRHSHKDPISARLVLVDEASMISLPMMAKLLDALRPDAKLIFLGDKDQLSSVEAGCVLGDLCSLSGPFAGHIAELDFNYRSKAAPNITALSAQMRALERENVHDFCTKLLSFKTPENDFFVADLPSVKKMLFSLKQFCRKISPVNESAPHQFGDLPVLARSSAEEDLKTAFHLLDHFKILCAVRKGPYGVENINRLMQELLNMHGEYPPGMPVMILQNDPVTGLANGDIGLIVKNPELKFCFCNQDGFRFYSPSELPQWEPAFAMTVHKSQGSGFDNVLIILPDKTVPILTMELFYTALTRARKQVAVWTAENVLQDTLSARIYRCSGLRDLFQ